MSHFKGIVAEVGVAKVKVRIPDLDDLVTDWLPVSQPVGLGAQEFKVPRKDSQVWLVPGLGLEDAIVGGCLYSQTDPAPWSDPMLLGLKADDGTVILYDPTAHLLTIKRPDRIEIETTVLSLKGDLELEGNLRQTGDQEIDGKVHSTGDILGDGTTSGHHTHPVANGVAQRGTP